MSSAVGSKKIDLHRVHAIVMKQSVVERIYGLGGITIQTTDATSPAHTIRDISNTERVTIIVRQIARLEGQRRQVLPRDEA